MSEIEIFNTLSELRNLSGNAQLNYLQENKNAFLKDILEYTYNPHKKYHIDEGKFNKFYEVHEGTNQFSMAVWQIFKYAFLNHLESIKSAKDSDIKDLVEYLYNFDLETQNFLKMVIFKDLRLNMGIKEFQKVWPGFCVEPQVQLAQKWEGQIFQQGFYSRKLDGVRNYILDGICYSRANKKQNHDPIAHIEEQIKSLEDFQNYVFDGELIYLNTNGSEDFKKAISLIRSEKRDELCDNIYFIIFDIIKKVDFLNNESLIPFESEYNFIKNYLGVSDGNTCWFKTKLPNVLVIKQLKEEESAELKKECKKLKWEGLMYRDGDAPYEFKRTKSLLKIKEMKDIELKLIDMEEGTGKYQGKLGAFVLEYENSTVRVGSGFSDELRSEYWSNKEKYIGNYVKTQYFEETKNSDGVPSLRFPVFLCFRDLETNEEFLLK